MGADNEITKAALLWKNTPYRHQASLVGVGCDCLGLVRGLFVEITGRTPETPPPYTPDWAEAAGKETLIAAASRHLGQIPAREAAPGDVVIFRLAPGAMAKHAGVLVAGTRMVHAYSGRAVVEVHLGPWWRHRLAAAFVFPGVTD